MEGEGIVGEGTVKVQYQETKKEPDSGSFL